VLEEEVSAKTAHNITMRTRLARFPFVKTLETFDFAYQPSLDKKQLHQLATCHFIEHGENLVILGPPGVGKTHLAVALGLKAITQGDRVLFTTAAALITTLTKASTEGHLEEKPSSLTIQVCSAGKSWSQTASSWVMATVTVDSSRVGSRAMAGGRISASRRPIAMGVYFLVDSNPTSRFQSDLLFQ